MTVAGAPLARSSAPRTTGVGPGLRGGARRDGLKGARIGVLRQAYERDTTDAEIVKVFMAAIEDLKRAGAMIVDPARVDLDAGPRGRRVPAPCGGFKYDINRYLAAQGDRVPVHSLDGDHQVAAVPPDVQRRLEQAQEGTENGPGDAGVQGRGGRTASRCARRSPKTMDAQKLDAFVYPTWSNPPRLIGDLNTPHGDNSQFFSPTTGFPAINVPMGYTRGDAAGRHDVLRPRLGRSDADQTRLRLRAGDAPSASAAARRVPQDLTGVGMIDLPGS